MDFVVKFAGVQLKMELNYMLIILSLFQRVEERYHQICEHCAKIVIWEKVMS